MKDREAYHQSVLNHFGLEARKSDINLDPEVLESVKDNVLEKLLETVEIPANTPKSEERKTAYKREQPSPRPAASWTKAEDPFGFNEVKTEEAKPKDLEVKKEPPVNESSSAYIDPEASASIPATVVEEDDEAELQECTTPATVSSQQYDNDVMMENFFDASEPGE